MTLAGRLRRELETQRKNRELLSETPAQKGTGVDQNGSRSFDGPETKADPLTQSGPGGVPRLFGFLNDRLETERLPHSIANQLERLRNRQQRSERSNESAPDDESESELGGEIQTTPAGPLLYLSELHEYPSLQSSSDDAASRQQLVLSLAQLLLGEQIECEPSQIAFIDTETTGLSGGTGTYAFLVGIGSWHPTGFLVEQFFMRDFDEEGALLSALEERLGQVEILITFNGKCFDLPLLESRFVLHRRSWLLNQSIHLDLLHPARRLWKLRLKDCSLSNLERHVLGVQRENDIPGHLIPQVYFNYTRSGVPTALKAILQHNRQDIRSLAELTLTVARMLLGRTSREGLMAEDLFGAAKYLEVLGQRQRSLQLGQEALERGAPASLKVQVLRELAGICRSERSYSRAVALWREMVATSGTFEAEACENLAIYYEHRVKDLTQAIQLVEYAIRQIESVGQNRSVKLDRWLHRRARLQRKIGRMSMHAQT